MCFICSLELLGSVKSALKDSADDIQIGVCVFTDKNEGNLFPAAVTLRYTISMQEFSCWGGTKSEYVIILVYLSVSGLLGILD